MAAIDKCNELLFLLDTFNATEVECKKLELLNYNLLEDHEQNKCSAYEMCQVILYNRYNRIDCFSIDTAFLEKLVAEAGCSLIQNPFLFTPPESNLIIRGKQILTNHVDVLVNSGIKEGIDD